ncbi:MAG: peptidoglycan DD-metalloendopeptidase family protein [Clostridia bacterium]|nr:peptidoglycan DD-metalloendopeptidase family protein [Clostridia bacterium]
MKKRIAAIISIILEVALCFAVALPAIFGIIGYADELQDKLEQNEAEQKEIKEKLNEKKSERKAKEAEKRKVDEEISDLNSQIDSLNQTIANNTSAIADKEAEIADIEKQIADSDALLKQRLRVMYEKGTTSYLDILFSAESFSDLLVRADMVSQLMMHDHALIDELTQKKSGIVAAKQAIEEKRRENVEAKGTIASQKKTLDAKSARSDELIAELREDEAYLQEEYEKRVAENERILEEIQAKIGSGAKVAAYSGGQLGWPSTSRGTITSEFGTRTFRGRPDNHTGIDIAVPQGTPVLAAEDGVVLVSGWSKSGYGNYITINHGSITTLYAHNSVLQVNAGQTVKKGQQIALAGSTGNSTGPHIHFGVIDNSTGKYTNPRPYIF